MATTAGRTKARTDLVRRARMGPYSLWTALVGTFVGGVVFAALLAGAHTVLRQNESAIDLARAWDQLGRKGVLIYAGLGFLAVFTATFLVGRMAWRRGWLNGLAAELDLRDRMESETVAATAEAARAHAATPAPAPPVAASARAVERRNGAGPNGDASRAGGVGGVDLDDVDVDALSRDELYGLAQELDVPGRSQMTKEVLARAVRQELSQQSR